MRIVDRFVRKRRFVAAFLCLFSTPTRYGNTFEATAGRLSPANSASPRRQLAAIELRKSLSVRAMSSEIDRRRHARRGGSRFRVAEALAPFRRYIEELDHLPGRAVEDQRWTFHAEFDVCGVVLEVDGGCRSMIGARSVNHRGIAPGAAIVGDLGFAALQGA